MPLPHVKFLLREQVFQALLVSEYLKGLIVKIVSPNLLGEDNDCKF